MSGEKPSSGTLHYTNNILDGGHLVIGDYKVTFNQDGKIDKTEKNTGSSSSESGNNGSQNVTNPYLTSFDGNYTAYKWKDVSTDGYTDAGSHHNSSNWYTSLNQNSKEYLRTDGATPELCCVFGTGQVGTVCMTAASFIDGYSTGEYSDDDTFYADFEDSSGYGVGDIFYTIEETGLKGYSREKVDEMFKKGAHHCKKKYMGEDNYVFECYDDENETFMCGIDNYGSVYSNGLVVRYDSAWDY